MREWSRVFVDAVCMKQKKPPENATNNVNFTIQELARCSSCFAEKIAYQYSCNSIRSHRKWCRVLFPTKGITHSFIQRSRYSSSTRSNLNTLVQNQDMHSKSSSILVVFFTCITFAIAIGMSVPPVVKGGQNQFSSLTNLVNCISYSTSKDDIIMLNVKSGEKTPSQQLNLRVFDSEDNTLRFMQDISGERSIIFTNLNNPVQIPQSESKNRMGMAKRRHIRSVFNEAPISGKSQVHICFDNVYFDKSWSFQKRSRDVHLDVNIRNITTLKNTNYNNYARYFSPSPNAVDENSDSTRASSHDFTENDFNNAVQYLQTLLNEVSEELKASEGTLKKLQLLESELRNVNELIFESFTRTSLTIIVTICVLGAAQLVYIHFILRRRKLL